MKAKTPLTQRKELSSSLYMQVIPHASMIIPCIYVMSELYLDIPYKPEYPDPSVPLILPENRTSAPDG